MTTYNATSDDNAVKLTIFCFQWKYLMSAPWRFAKKGDNHITESVYKTTSWIYVEIPRTYMITITTY